MPLAGLPIGKRSALLLDKENMTKYSISPMSSLYELYLRHPRISTDSRRIEPDSVFFALRGASFDGNRFAADALEKGAAYAVVDDPSLPNTRPDKADRYGHHGRQPGDRKSTRLNSSHNRESRMPSSA